MCTHCGCNDPALVSLELHESLLAANNERARHNRRHFEESSVLAINLMGSPGCGKTALLEATAQALAHAVKIVAVSADLATDNDAQRLRAAGIPCTAITTGQACHLDAALVHHALHETPYHHAALLFIENVGNLICPAIYDLGQAVNVVMLSVTEGEDKPLKYPVMFKAADLVVLSKCDLLPYLDVDVTKVEHNLARVMPKPALLKLSAKTGLGVDAWKDWLHAKLLRR